MLGMLVLGVSAQESKLAYQGRLTEAGTPATGTFEMQFQLFDSPEVGTGTVQGREVSLPEVAVQEGVFTAVLDFGVEVFDPVEGEPVLPFRRLPRFVVGHVA